MLFTEIYDINAMESLLRHDGVSHDFKKRLRAYKKRTVNGNKVHVEYTHGKDWKTIGIGRFYVMNSIGLQAFPKQIRACLAQKYYWDVDMRNAQPIILLEIAKREGWVCDTIKEFVDNRETILSEIMVNCNKLRDEAKELCISVFFGDSRNEHPIFPKLYEELIHISNNIGLKHPELLKHIKKLEKRNPLSSLCAIYAQDIENRILLCTNEFLKGINRPFEVLIFDGGFIRKLDNETFFPPHILRDMESYILKEMNYKIEFDVKPLNHSFNFVIDNLIPENIIIDDSYGAEQFSKIVEARRVGNDIYIFNPNTERWGCSKTDIDTAIIANKSLLQFKQNSPTGIKLYNYGGCIKNINCMKSLIPMFIKEDKLPIQLEYQFNDIDSNTRVLELFNILLDLLSNNNAITRDYLLNWIAQMIQKPYDIPKTCLVITGIEGSGKDTLFDLIGNFIIGNNLYHNYNKTHQFFEKHDTSRANKLLVKLEEANKLVCYENDDLLKSFITSETQNFNPKNDKPFCISNYNRFVFTTNKGNPIKLSQTDRRFVLFNSSSEKCNDKPFWVEVRNLLFTKEAGATIGNYLESVDISNFNPMVLPPSDYKEMVMDIEENLERKFIRTIGDEWNDWLTMGNIFILYSNWCKKENCSAIGANNAISLGKRFIEIVRDGLVLRKVTNTNAYYIIKPK